MLKPSIFSYSYYVVCTGFTLSALIHVSTYFGFDPEWHFPWIFILHILCIVMGFVAFKKNSNHSNLTNSILNDPDFAPIWLKVGCVWFFIYAIFNFIFSMAKLDGGGPEIVNGLYVLSSHGSILKKLTFEEYCKYQSLEVRLFSGHWMIFYIIEMLFLYPRPKTGESTSINPVS